MENVLDRPIISKNNKDIICAPDEQELAFEQLLRLWVDNKISYDKLIENVPDSYLSKWKKFLKDIITFGF